MTGEGRQRQGQLRMIGKNSVTQQQEWPYLSAAPTLPGLHIQHIRTPACLLLPRALRAAAQLLPPLLPLLLTQHPQRGHQLLQPHLVTAACGRVQQQTGRRRECGGGGLDQLLQTMPI